MREPPIKPVVRFSENLNRLIDKADNTVTKVAGRAGVQPKQVYNLMDAGHDFRLKSCEKVANAFGLSAWQMLAVDFTEKPAQNKQILMLLELFSRADTAGREAIMRVAEVAASKPSK